MPSGSESAQMAEIRIERLGTCHGEEHRSEGEEPQSHDWRERRGAIGRADPRRCPVRPGGASAADGHDEEQKAVIGPKSEATLAVPNRWTAKG